jgi:hypothetical protein
MKPLLMAVTLVWNANTEPDLAGYNIYYGVMSATYTNKLSVGLVTTNILSGLAPGVTFFCAVTAFNTSDAESEFSNEISWREPERIEPPLVVATKCDAGSITLSWGSVPGAVYRVSGSIDLSVAWYGWADLTGDLVATGETMEWSEPADEPEAFYRVVRLH